jgi:nicotinamidase-related amidase
VGNMKTLLRVLALALALVILETTPSSATDIFDDWATVKAPPPPELKAVTLDGHTTALLLMDLGKKTCSNPRCQATVPNIRRLHDAAEAAGAMVWYALTGDATADDFVDPASKPRDGEWEIRPGPDKFLNSDLDDKLKAKGIKTVIVCGVSFQGVGVGTATEAAERGYKVIVPIDCLSSGEDRYAEQYSAWHLSKSGPGSVTRAVTLTRSTMVKF